LRSVLSFDYLISVIEKLKAAVACWISQGKAVQSFEYVSGGNNGF
jgi:hypothetical protein